MKKYNRLKLLLVFTLVVPFAAYAQQKAEIKYILPDGKQITEDKLDSIRKAWNGVELAFQHNDEDDKAHVIHVIKMTSEMARKFDENTKRSLSAIHAMTGQTAPDFTLMDMNGKSWTLSSLKGKVVVLNFWFTSCGPCIQEMPTLNDLVSQYGDKDVVFLGVTYNDHRSVDVFLKEHEFRYTLLPSSQKVDKKYQISAWPTSFVIGRDGKVKMAINSDKQISSKLSVWIDRALSENI